jgi:hypothetical protein
MLQEEHEFDQKFIHETYKEVVTEAQRRQKD